MHLHYKLSTVARPVAGALLALGLSAWLPGGPKANADQSKEVKAGHVRVRLYADRAALRPGEPFRVAILFKLDDDWHLYWSNPGIAGMPPEVEWQLPAGFQAGRMRFPVPELKYDKELEGDSYILAGEPILVAPIRAPASLVPGEPVTLRAKIKWLACKKECIPGRAEVEMKLPVVAASAPAAGANGKVFESAEAAFPEPLSKAEHVKISTRIESDALKPGQQTRAVLTAELPAGHHMQSHKPLQDGLIPAVVFVEPTSGLEIGEVEYPKAHERSDKTLGKLSEYSGKSDFWIPITVEEKPGTSPRWVRGVFQYQICTDGGTCYAPQQLEFAIPVRMEGGPAPAALPDDWAAASAITRPREPAIQNGPVQAESPRVGGYGEAGNLLTRLQDRLIGLGYYGVLVAALLGGLILNLMPCVLPVISLKVLSFVRQANEDRGRIFRLGLTYSAGILVFFGVLAALFAWTGTGWGQLFQRPHVVLALAAIVTAFALSLFGVFALFPPRIVNQLGEKVEGEGYGSAFATGLLATFLGTACTAPFLSAAVGAASKYPGVQGAAIFLAVGVGMAFPFVLLAAQPAWLKFVPRPGPWMGTFEAVMGFLLLGTVIWLMNPLRDQIGDFGMLLSLVFLLFVAMAAWVKGKIQFGDPFGRKARLSGVALALVALGWALPFEVFSSIPELRHEVDSRRKLIGLGKLAEASGGGDGAISWRPDWSKGIPWQDFNQPLIRRFVEGGYTVFVDYTASWCVNCKVNLKTSIDVAETRRLMRELNVVPFEADYTNEDPEIKKSLKAFGKAGVPLYLVYSPGKPDRPELLPELLTPQLVADALRRAGSSRVQLAKQP